MTDRDALLAANAAFYAAFNAGDPDAMARLWAHGDGVACLHPGWPVLLGREAVLESWRRIFAAGATPTVTCLDPHTWPGGDGGMVICHERVAGQLLAATNLFRLEKGILRLHHHQSGPCAEPQGSEPGATRH
jgi:ketosteroid isomerase-like protein